MAKDVTLVRPAERVEAARFYFKKALEKRVPEVLTTLISDVLPAYSAITHEIARKSYSRLPLRPLSDVGKMGPEIPPDFDSGGLPLYWRQVRLGSARTKEAKRLEAALASWGQRFQFNFNDEWLFDLAVVTLFTYKQELDTGGKPQPVWGFIPYSVGWGITMTERIFDFWEDEGWEFEIESWNQFEERISASFREYLDWYQKKIVTLALERGWSQPPEIRSREHFEWLALFQAKQYSPKKILQYCNLDMTDNAVFKAIQQKAKLIGLTLRPSKYNKPPR